jgi:hypothetical protein
MRQRTGEESGELIDPATLDRMAVELYGALSADGLSVRVRRHATAQHQIEARVSHRYGYTVNTFTFSDEFGGIANMTVEEMAETVRQNAALWGDSYARHD